MRYLGSSIIVELGCEDWQTWDFINVGHGCFISFTSSNVVDLVGMGGFCHKVAVPEQTQPMCV